MRGVMATGISRNVFHSVQIFMCFTYDCSCKLGNTSFCGYMSVRLIVEG